ncbi:hypothetical protein SLS60_007916 [Paraconiothyrium brasiliense]|uniref:Uncharacterized protein n=1 Tax=Paraconiothyrium brasiliense TaxID=300254 RepID=A0ABR3R2W6_9PLEO
MLRLPRTSYNNSLPILSVSINAQLSTHNFISNLASTTSLLLNLLIKLEMAKSRKAREKRLATKKGKASPKKEDTTTTTIQTPSTTKAYGASSYRMTSSSLARSVEVFSASNQPRRTNLQYSDEPPIPEHPAKKICTSRVQDTATTTSQFPPTPDVVHSSIYRLPSSVNHPVEDSENPAPLGSACSPHPHDYTAKILNPVRKTADDVLALIESKKVVSLSSLISTSVSDPKNSAQAEVEVFRNSIDAASNQVTSGQKSFPDSRGDGVASTLAGDSYPHEGFAARPYTEERETVATGKLDTWTLCPPVVVTDNSSSAPELRNEELNTTSTQSTAHEQKTDGPCEEAKDNSSARDARKAINIQTQDDEVGAPNHGTNSFPETKLEATSMHSVPITPVFPVFDVDHSSPTSSHSSFHYTSEKQEKMNVGQQGKVTAKGNYVEDKHNNHHRKNWKASRSGGPQHGRAIECLGPSIMFRLFGGVLE